MATVHLPRERWTWKVGSTRAPRLSFDEVLETDELLTGSPTVVDDGNSNDLTITNIAVSTAALTIKNETIATGRALTFSVLGHTVANAPYTLTITASTDATVPQTFVKQLIIDVEA